MNKKPKQQLTTNYTNKHVIMNVLAFFLHNTDTHEHFAGKSLNAK